LVRIQSRCYARLTEISDADEPTDGDYLRELAFQQICLPRDTVSASPKPSSAAGDGNSQQERDYQRAKRRFTPDITQDAQRHPGLSTRFYRAANSMDCPFHSFGDFRDGGFPFWNGIQALVGERGQWAVITHDLISKPTNNQSRRELF
jgi:hypothetical protein